VSKDIEVVIRDADNVCELARIEQGYVPDDHVAMALVRAVNGGCVQLGIEPPAELFARAAEAARPAEVTKVQGHIARAQVETINRALAELGYGGEGAIGVIDVIAKLEQRAHVARMLGPDFAPALRLAREVYPLAVAVDRALDARESPGQPKAMEHSQLSALRNAVDVLGQLLNQLRRIDPEPVDNGDGTTTVTLTEAVEIGTPATASEATP
jgi:hypothetical protein